MMAKGHLIGVTGVPGSGKSYFARSARDVGKTAIALLDPKEESFYGAGASVFADLEWRPQLSKFDATGFRDLLTWVAKQADDPSVQFIVIDPMSEGSDLALHEVLKIHQTNDPSDLSHGRAYTGHDQQMKQLITECRRAVVRGKTVICTFHGKMKELEGVGPAKKAKGMSGEMEWKFDEQMLPVLNTSLRQSIHSPFDLWLYTVPTGFGPGRNYLVTAIPDQVRPAKHSVKFKAGTNPAMLPNNIKTLLEALDE